MSGVDLRFVKSDDGYVVYRGADCICSVSCYNNPYHMTNRYIRLSINEFDDEVYVELFRTLRNLERFPLQVMINSGDTELINCLTAGGFVLRRKCYEVEVCLSDYVGGGSNVQIERCSYGDLYYNAACKLMFDYYVSTHEAINAWTGGYEKFCDILPKTVLLSTNDGDVTSVAFVDGNEIAYVCAGGEHNFFGFIRSVVKNMFEEYETICFECDDCDIFAMSLKSMFTFMAEQSFDTYIYD